MCARIASELNPDAKHKQSRSGMFSQELPMLKKFNHTLEAWAVVHNANICVLVVINFMVIGFVHQTFAQS